MTTKNQRDLRQSMIDSCEEIDLAITSIQEEVTSRTWPGTVCSEYQPLLDAVVRRMDRIAEAMQEDGMKLDPRCKHHWVEADPAKLRTLDGARPVATCDKCQGLAQG